MFFRNCLFVCAILGITFGCTASPDVAGSYRTEVSQGSNGVVTVGDMNLGHDGSFQASLGQLSMSGTWTAGNGLVFLHGSDEASSLLPSQYRIDGDRLIAQYEGVDARQWRFVRTSKALANRVK